MIMFKYKNEFLFEHQNTETKKPSPENDSNNNSNVTKKESASQNNTDENSTVSAKSIQEITFTAKRNWGTFGILTFIAALTSGVIILINYHYKI